MSVHKKITAIVLLLVAAYFASIAVGVYRLKSSALYPITENALASHLKSINSKEAAGPFHMKWYAPWQYSAGASKGLSQFLLCTTSGRCYRMTAVKIDGTWNIDWQFQNTATGGR
jgi:hypothetical protein